MIRMSREGDDEAAGMGAPMRNVTLSASAAIAVLLGSAAHAGTGHQWGDYRWNTNGSTGTNVLALDVSYKFADKAYWLKYYVDATGGGVTGALKKWDDGTATYPSPLALNDKGETTTTTSAACDHIDGEVLVCADAYGTTEGWVGIAEIDADASNHILWATARFNDSYYRAAPYSATYDNDAQRQFVSCHEIGHTFGLGHLDTSFYNPNKGSCMDYTADPDGDGRRSKDNRNPGDVDWQVLLSNTMYGTLSGGGGKGGGKPRLDPFEFREVGSASPSPEGIANGRFGRIVAYDDLGRPVEYVRDLANGHKRITFVTWAKGYRPEDSR
jgi:hypothetical protein